MPLTATFDSGRRPRVSGEFVELVNDAAPFVVTAVSTYGTAVLAQAQDEAVTATVGLGRRLTQRIFGTRTTVFELPEVLIDVVEQPNAPDNLGALRKAIRQALIADPELAADVRRLLSEAGGVRVVGDHSNVVANSRIDGDVIQIGRVGGDARIHRS
jgi:hypothetical protein